MGETPNGAGMNETAAGNGRKVLVTGAELAEEAVNLLAGNSIEIINVDGYSGAERIAELAARHAVDALLVRQGKIDSTVINASARLRVIAKHGSGVDNIDLAAASARGVPVLRALAANAQSVAELAVSLTLSLMKDVVVLDATVKAGGWPKSKYVGRDLAGARFGVVGFGEIGRRVARLAGALGMETLAYDPFAADQDGTPVARDLDVVLSWSDVVSLHCPLTADTHHLINAARLATMKPTAFLVNTARGAIVDEAALVVALNAGAIAGAGLDSFELEPPGADNPLLAMNNVIATPHVGGASRSALRNMAVQSAQHIIDVLGGTPFDRKALANPDIV
jgi:D-3-phosphoglycerate dehydrogenase